MKPPRLLALTPGDLEDTRDPRFLGALRSALEAGLRGVLIREPLLEDRDWLLLAESVRALGAECVPDGGLWLGVHDRVHLAGALRAEGVHLGFRSLAADVVRRRFGDAFAIGLSTHPGDDPASWRDADYLFHGPVFDTLSKKEGTPGWRSPIGLEGLAAFDAATEKPTWALGGIAPGHAAQIREFGVYGIAVLSGILLSPEPAAATAAYLAALGPT